MVLVSGRKGLFKEVSFLEVLKLGWMRFWATWDIFEFDFNFEVVSSFEQWIGPVDT